MPDTRYYASFGKSNMYEMKPWIQGEWAGPICGTPPNKYSDNLKPPAKLELGNTRCCRAPPMPAVLQTCADAVDWQIDEKPEAAAKVINFLLNSKEGWIRWAWSAACR
jgi:oligogalacturonide transport system substrate-binding protein